MAPREDDRGADTEDRTAVMAQVVEAPADFYDDRYRHGYQRELLASGYDACVLTALRWALARVRAGGKAPGRILDLGCGQGRYMGELAAAFPRAELAGADVSHVGLDLARERFGAAEYLEIGADGVIPAEDESFELITMIDVIEHVIDASRTARALHRLLRPGGWAVLTTPCANKGSIAWIFNLLTNGFEETLDGYGRFRTDEPAHLRRLRSRDARKLLTDAGLEVDAIRWWGHLFTAIADAGPGIARLPLPMRQSLARADWRMGRRLPNGSAMLVVARKNGG